MDRLKEKYIQDEGIVLATRDIGEADKILTILTSNFGKLEILAKNVKKLDSRRAPACDMLAYGKFVITRNRSPTLSEVANITHFPKIKSNLEKLSLAFQALELLDLIIPKALPAPDVFNIFLVFLKKLNVSESLQETKVALATFQVKLLVKTGWLDGDFKLDKFSNFASLEKFLLVKFENIIQKKLKSWQFAKIVLGTNN